MCVQSNLCVHMGMCCVLANSMHIPVCMLINVNIQPFFNMYMLLSNITPWESEFHIFEAMTVKNPLCILQMNMLSTSLNL